MGPGKFISTTIISFYKLGRFKDMLERSCPLIGYSKFFKDKSICMLLLD